MARAKSARLNLRVDPELLEGLKRYAKRCGLSLTSLVELQLREILRAEEAVDAEQV